MSARPEIIPDRKGDPTIWWMRDSWGDIYRIAFTHHPNHPIEISLVRKWEHRDGPLADAPPFEAPL